MTNHLALIVDDEPLARQNLAAALALHPGWTLAGQCASVTEARPWLVRQPVDLVLLDIRMPGESGIDFAGELALRADAPCIAFVTAYDDRAIDAFDLFALDYLLKPFDDARFARLIERVETMLSYRAAMAQAVAAFADDQGRRCAGQAPPPLEFLTIRSIGMVERIPINEVEWIGTAGNYVELHLPGRSVLHRCALCEIERRLPPAEFLRIHRTAIVRRQRLRGLVVDGADKYRATMASGAQPPVSEQHVDAVRRELGC